MKAPVNTIAFSIFAGSGATAHTDGTGTGASFNKLRRITTDSSDTLYATEQAGYTIRKIATPGAVVTTLAGTNGSYGEQDGVGTSAKFTDPWGITADSSGTLFVTDFGGHTIRKITVPGAVVTTFAGFGNTLGNADGLGTTARFNQPVDIVNDAAGNLYEPSAKGVDKMKRVSEF